MVIIFFLYSLYFRIRQIPLLFANTMRSYLHEQCNIGERHIVRIAIGTMRLQLEFRGQGSLERRAVNG